MPGPGRDSISFSRMSTWMGNCLGTGRKLSLYLEFSFDDSVFQLSKCTLI